MSTVREGREEESRRPDGGAVAGAGNRAAVPACADLAQPDPSRFSEDRLQSLADGVLAPTVVIEPSPDAASNVARPIVDASPLDESSAAQTQQDELVNIRDPNFSAGAVTSAPQCFGLTEDEGRRLLRIISDSVLIERHYQLFLWLTGELRQFLPHDIFVSVWGNFAKGHLKIDVISSLPGVRTEQVSGCQLHEVIESAHGLWQDAGRQARLLRIGEALRINGCNCQVHAALRGMKSVLIHGVRDERGGYESLYLAFATGPQLQGRGKDRFLSLMNAVVPQIDVAFRKVAAYPLHEGGGGPAGAGKWLDLSTREQQILDGVCLGKKNVDIADELGISHFTVKNHIQRIFKKIGASNRTQAAAKYNQTVGKYRQPAE
jgi:transcriptional regulator EpsA